MKNQRRCKGRSLKAGLTVGWVAGAVLSMSPLVHATEHGGSTFPVGAETVMTGMEPRPGQTMFYEFTAVYAANETDGSNGKAAPVEFRLRVFANAIKMSHTWDFQLLGGHFNTNLSIPATYEQLHVAPGTFEKYAIGNMDVVPFGLNYSKGVAHWYYEADVLMPGADYSSGDVLNIGQHNFAAGPVAGVTLLPNHGATEISARNSYLFNGPDRDTGYHSGNEYFTEFNVDQAVTRRMALGVNGAIYRQTTDDRSRGVAAGCRGRDLQIGPQARFELGHHGAFALKYYRDTLVENKPRGNAFWFQLGLPLRGLSRRPS